MKNATFFTAHFSLSKLFPFALTSLLSIFTPQLIAAQILFSNPTGTDWLTASNWNGSIVPTSSQIAQFGANPTSGSTGVGIDMSKNTGAQSVGAIELTSSRAANLVIGNSANSTSGVLTIAGTTVNGVSNVILKNSSAYNLVLQNTQGVGLSTMSIALTNTTDNKILISNSGNINVACAINGGTNKPLTFDGTGANGKLILTAKNSYTGLTTINGGTLQLNNNGGITIQSSNNVVINNGVLQISSNQVLNNVSLLGGTILIDAGVDLTISGTLTMGGGTITGSGTFNYGISSTLSYTTSYTTTKREFPDSGSVVNLTVNCANATDKITLDARKVLQATGTLTFTNGIIDANGYTLKVTNSSQNAVIQTNGFIIGNLERSISLSTPRTYLFPVGSANSYTPASLTFKSVPSSGRLVVATNGFVSSNYPTSLNPTKYINRYWTMKPAISGGLTGGTYIPTFTYAPTDIINNASTNNMKPFKYAAGFSYATDTVTVAAVSKSFTYDVQNYSGNVEEYGVGECPAVASITGTTAICKGSSTTLSNATSNGIWSSSNTNVATVNTSGVVTSVNAGTTTITYTVTNAINGCVGTATTNVLVNDVPTISANKIDDPCQIGAGSITITILGGSPAYSLSGCGTTFAPLIPGQTVSVSGSPTNIVSSGGSKTFTNLKGNVNYSFTATDSKGCIAH